MALLNVEQCAELLNTTVSNLHQLASRREIPHFEKSKMIYFDRDEIERWIRSGKVPTKDEIAKLASRDKRDKAERILMETLS